MPHPLLIPNHLFKKSSPSHSSPPRSGHETAISMPETPAGECAQKMRSKNRFELTSNALTSCRRKFFDEAVGVYQTRFDTTAFGFVLSLDEPRRLVAPKTTLCSFSPDHYYLFLRHSHES